MSVPFSLVGGEVWSGWSGVAEGVFGGKGGGVGVIAGVVRGEEGGGGRG